jgi:hypothetical protein
MPSLHARHIGGLRSNHQGGPDVEGVSLISSPDNSLKVYKTEQTMVVRRAQFAAAR